MKKTLKNLAIAIPASIFIAGFTVGAIAVANKLLPTDGNDELLEDVPTKVEKKEIKVPISTPEEKDKKEEKKETPPNEERPKEERPENGNVPPEIDSKKKDSTKTAKPANRKKAAPITE